MNKIYPKSCKSFSSAFPLLSASVAACLKHMNTIGSIRVLGLFALGLLSIAASAHATVIVHYTFDDSENRFADSSGNGYDLTNSVGTQTYVDNAFGVGDDALSNSSIYRVYRSSNAAFQAISDFTLEATINYTSFDSGTYYVLGQWDGTGAQRSYSLGVNSDGYLVLEISSDGTIAGMSTYTSSFTISASTNYYIGVSFDLSDQDGGIVFYGLDLDSSGATLLTSVVSHTLTTLNTPTARFVVGNRAYSGADIYTFDGLIGEVRVSDSVLTPGQLLISVPEPAGAAWLLGFAVLAVLAMKRRLKKDHA
ncbi:MAG: LamG-like jellyroll fold domain-containing protein [Verrucomicrobiota bacterium JB024]|nr:LamG-like jellyroll fold domain-containing protein [Verrucomicrobiota bacterium JB024]